MLPSQFKRMQKEKQNKPLPLRKISNNFLFNAVENSNPHTLKTMFYLASILRDLDLKNKDDEELVEFYIDREKMEQYTMIDIVSIRKSLKTMQKTSISFVNDVEKIETNINLLPLYEVIYNKNQIRLKLFVKVAKMLIDVETNYSYLNTKQFMKLDSKHSIRMLGLLNKIDGYDRPTDKEYKLKKIKDNLDLIRDYPDYAKTEKLEEQNRELSREQLPKVIELTLEDLKESLKTRQENKEAVTNLQTTSASEAISQVQDKQQNLDQENKTEPTKGEEDSPETTTKVEDSVNDPQEWFKQRIAEVGLAKASREYKIKFSILDKDSSNAVVVEKEFTLNGMKYFKDRLEYAIKTAK